MAAVLAGSPFARLPGWPLPPAAVDHARQDKAHAGPLARRFLNISSGECIRMDLPALEEHTLLSLTPEGLLLLLHEATLAVRLLNPLTQQVTDLPPLTALLTTELQVARRYGQRLGKSISVCGVGVVADASAVAVSLTSPMALVVAKPGDERWTLLDNRFLFRSTMTIAGRFYCATRSGVTVLDASSDQQQPPSLLAAVDWSGSLRFYPMADSLHLVGNGGDLMLVHRMLRRLDDDRHERKYEVYKVDLDAGVLIPAKSFGGRAMFMGMCRALSASPKAFFPHVAADTLYLGSDCSDRGTSYNLADGTSWQHWEEDTDAESCDCDDIDDGSSEPCYQFEKMQPPNIVDCLSYCIGGSGKELA